MKINIYYGGRGIPDDPCHYVLGRMESVLKELKVEVERYNIYENRNAISTLVSTVKEVDGIILASTVEWLGLGGYMTEFLDALWLYGDQDSFSRIYMQPVVLSTTYGEREGMHTLDKAWEILGGLPCEGLCGYVKDLVEFQINQEYSRIIEKKAENLYRTISQKTKTLPTSSEAVTQNVQSVKKLELTPQESENLSEFAANESFVRQQKEDVAELAAMFRGMMGETEEDDGPKYEMTFAKHFKPVDGFFTTYQFIISGRNLPLNIRIKDDDLSVTEGEADTETTIKISFDTLDGILHGRQTFQGAFNVGDLTAKGNIGTISMLDKVFEF